ncbi:hypothetical protein V9T40_009506 [Parthenolecanium corni]|uniref:Uncharacterized protein n=1 Tax=Parthenolecanium corni TaxID=536013 RepID=A0AAN9TSM2_9HEMI
MSSQAIAPANRADEPKLELLPKENPISKPKGENFALICQAVVSNVALVTNLRWLDPKNQTIDKNYLNVNRRLALQDESSARGRITLLINTISENDVGQYTCTAEYNQQILFNKKDVNIFRPIKFIDANPEQSAKLGSSYKIVCKVEADPSPQVTWMRNGQKVNNNNPRFTFDVDGLTINGVQESDDGGYSCEAVVPDTGEFKTQNINFEVISTPQVIATETSSPDVIEGESVNVKCNATGKPKPTIKWISVRDGSVLPSVGVDGTLYFERIAKKDGGQYKCVAANKAGQDEKSITLNIVSKPEIVESVNATVLVGKSGKLQCYVEGFPTPKIRIVKKGPNSQDTETNELGSQTLIKEDPKKRPNTYLATLNLNNVQRSMDGLYECIAVNEVANKHVKTVSSLHLTVEFQPTFEKTAYVKEQITWGTRAINLTCIAEAIPNASIEWFRGSNVNKITPTGMYKIHGTGPKSDLEITPNTKDVYGPYRCEATNTHGRASHTITLNEAFPPQAIGAVEKSEVTASSVTFRFADSMYTGKLPIKGYSAQYLQDDESDWNRAKEQTWPFGGPYVLRDLKPLGKYSFRFRAFNEAGSGAWGGFTDVQMPEISSPSEPVITNPIEPNEKYIKSTLAHQIALKWTIPTNNGADIDKYIVKYCPAQQDQNLQEGFFVSQENCQTQDIPFNSYLSQYTVENLNSKSFYRVELTAHNNIGFSKASQRFFLTSGT